MKKFIIRIFCALIPFTNLRKYCRKQLNYIASNGLKSYITMQRLKCSYQDQILMYPFQGFGEIVMTGIYIKEFKKYHQNKKVIFLIEKKGHYLMAKELLKDVDAVLQLDKASCAYLQNYATKGNKKDGQRDYLDISLKSYALKNLNLTSKAKQNPQIIQPSQKIINLFQNYNLMDGKTVFISPDAVSFNEEFDQSKWHEIATKLSEKGFDVVFNSNKKNFYGYRTVFLSPKETLEFILLSGNFIGFRSGLCDVIASHLKNVKSFLFYPKASLDEFTSEDAYLKYFSVKLIFDNHHTKEVVYDNFSSLKENIISYF